MTDKRKIFSLWQRKKQLDHSLQPSDGFYSSDEPDELQIILSSQPLTEDMRAYYQAERQENVASLEHVWSRISARLTEQTENRENPQLKQRPASTPIKFSPEKIPHRQKAPASQTPFKKFTGKTLGLLVAMLIMILLIGSFPFVFNFTRHNSSPVTARPINQPTATPTKISQKPGKVIFSLPQKSQNFSVAWSADGRRVADVSIDQIQIWDATTGQNQITVALDNGETNTATLAWSPTGELLALMTSERILVVNGQNGKIVSSYYGPKISSIPSSIATTAFTSGISAAIPASYQIHQAHLSTGSQFGGIAWSPDGRSIASTLNFANSDGSVDVWDTQTGQIIYMLTKMSGWNMGAASWSSDGKYIAVNMQNFKEAVNLVSVWSVQTKQLIFQQSGDGKTVFSDSTWQPGTDNLTFALPAKDAEQGEILQIWNVETAQLIKSIPQVTTTTVLWSPNGKEFAYRNFAAKRPVAVLIQNVDNNQIIYTHTVPANTDQSASISPPSWSPDGKYIVTAESVVTITTTSVINNVVTVWTT